MKNRVSDAAQLVSVLIALTASFAPAAFAAAHRLQPQGIRLEGSFSMSGTVTTAHNVYGEHPGQHVRRTWSFLPRCATGACDRVTLRRQRSGRHILDVVRLVRRSPTLYVGSGRFWVALRCAGAIVKHGGLATETITVRITGTATVGATRIATRLSATYANPVRRNLTRCPGGIGRDAARYRGSRTAPLPGPPIPNFTDTVDQLTSTAGFTDQSRAGGGGARIVSWSWDFGDPSSPDDTSGQQSPSHRYRSPGTYSVTLTVRDQYGQAAAVTHQVTV